MSLFAELKRRNVIRMAGLYLVGAWLIVQVTGTVLPMFDAPAWLPRSIVILLAVGFVPAIVIAWVFELTPQGLKRDAEVKPEESIAPLTARRMDRMLLIVVSIALVYLVVDKFVLAPRRDANRAESAAASPGRPGAAQAPLPVSDKSIAVLPFANLSEEKANAFFADGMQDEILTKLSKIGALRVVSRTSTQRYASAPDNLAEIARQLGVANVLEGSVQKSGNAVHINVQLIRAASDEHLWAESYNRSLDDVFGVQGEVAQAVADALKATLTGAERKAVVTKGTENPRAYEAWLRARVLDNAGDSFLDSGRALDNYLEAVHQDPNFAQAWAAAAVAMSNLYFNGYDTGRSTAAAVRQAADTAMRLQPDLAESVLARGSWLYRVQRDYPAATDMFKRALAMQPGDVDILVELFFVERRRGLWDDSLAYIRQAIARNPRDASLPMQAASEGYYWLHRYDEARTLLQQALAIEPGNSATYASLAQIEQRLGRLDAADVWLAHVPKDSRDFYERTVLSDQLNFRRDLAGLTALVEPALAGKDDALTNADLVAAIRLAFAQRAAGQAAARKTFERLAHVFASRPGGIDHIVNLAAQSPLVDAGLGNWDKAIAAARHQIEFNRNDVLEGSLAKAVLAQIYAQKGEPDAALALLPEVLELPCDITPAQLALDPLWDPIRNDPRFVALTRQPVSEYKLKPHD